MTKAHGHRCWINGRKQWKIQKKLGLSLVPVKRRSGFGASDATGLDAIEDCWTDEVNPGGVGILAFNQVVDFWS